MKHLRLLSIFIALFVAPLLPLVFGASHALFYSQTLSHMMSSSELSSQCQFVCPPLLTEHRKIIETKQDDSEPNPQPFWSLHVGYLSSAAYAATVSLVAFLFLRRKPPDLVLLYANLRI